MYFTQEDYKKIENWLHRNSVKDTEFQEALPFTGKEIVTVVQDGHNRKVNIQEFINQLYKHGVEDFLNVTNTYGANNITLKEAIRLIPAEARKEGQVITFLNTEGNWEIYQFTGKLNQWNNTTLWNNTFDWEKFVVDSILPDEEDLTKSAPDANGNAYLSLKNRKYEPDKYSGLGRKILRRRVVEIEDPIYGTQEKNLLLQADFAEDNTVYVVRYDFTLNGQDITLPDNSYIEYEGGSISDGNIIDRAGGINRVVLKKNIVNGKNILTQEMVSKSNTIYEIRYDFDLNGETITLPNNCVLKFEGGSLKNGTLIGVNTCILASNSIIFYNINILGIWKNSNVTSRWFSEYNELSLKNIMKLCVGDTQTYVSIEKANIDIKGYIDDSIDYDDGIHSFNEVLTNTTLIPSYTHVDFNGGTLTIIPNSRKWYSALSVIGSECVKIENLNILGDADTHTIGEYGFAIDIRGSKDVIINNLYAEKLSGDAIDLGEYVLEQNHYRCENIIIENSDFNKCRRNGISIIYGKNITIKNTSISDIGTINGTAPKCGIDIEPNKGTYTYGNREVDGVTINECNIIGCEGYSIDALAYQNVRTIHNVNINNTHVDGDIRFTDKSDNINIQDSKLKNILVSFENGSIKGCTINGVPSFYGSPNILLENCIITSDYNIQGTIIQMGILLNNNTNADYKNLIIQRNTINLFNYGNQSIIYQVYPICKSYNISEPFNVKGFPKFLDNTVVSNDLTPINLYCGNDTINNRLLCCQVFSLIKTDISNFKIIGNEVSNYFGGFTIHRNTLSKDFTANTNITIAQNKVNTPLYSNIFNSSATGISPKIIEAGNTINNVRPKFSSLSGVWSFEFKPEIGVYYYDNDEKKPFFRKDNDYYDAEGIIRGTIRHGITTNRPNTNYLPIGFQYFDITLNKPIWWIGSKWVDATGADV